MRVTVLGAGYMGSAMASVAAMMSHEVRLWGTWLDGDLLDAIEKKTTHPRLGLVLDPRIAPMRDLEAALDGAELVVHAVSSEGAVPVMSKAKNLPDVPILSVSKGFLPGKSGKMDRIDSVVAETVGRPLRFVHASGPAKAKEIARNVLTWMQFASKNVEDARVCAAAFGAPHMRIGTSSDIAGAEICSAMKNAYATGLGLFDGFVGPDCHNARAACFTQSVVEMARLVAAGGGEASSVFGAPGMGDLHVTAAAGRNRAFGERVGKGKPAKQVASEMLASGELTEGYPAIATAKKWAIENGVKDLPLLDALHAVIWEDADVGQTLASLRLST